ncbi:MAG: hypothetical protein COA42_17650 [Alteromonadaceae bacterium]|nr:MAG: hypothetical protein COA42_17650 [Alteromonadaceae bacterium]
MTRDLKPRTGSVFVIILLAFISFASHTLAQTPPNNPTQINAVNPENLNLRFQEVLSENLKSIGSINGIAQDRQGFMYFVSNGGLARYDGYDFKISQYTEQNLGSISTNMLNDLIVNNDDTMWIASYWGLNHYDTSTETFKHFLNRPDQARSLSNNNVMHLHTDSEGKLWVATQKGLSRFNPTTQDFDHFFHNPDDTASLASNDIFTLGGDNQGRIWVGLKNLGIDILDPRSGKIVQRFRHNPNNAKSLSNKSPTAIARDHNGQMWIGTYNGLNRYDGQGGFIRYIADPNDIHTLNSDKINDLFFDRDNRLWIAAGEKGLSLYRPKHEHFDNYLNDTNINPLSSRIVSINEDSSGSIWLGLSPSGILRLDRYASAFKNYSKQSSNTNSLSDNSAESVAEDELGNLWIGTSAGLNYFDRKTNNITRHIRDKTNPDKLPAYRITALLFDNPETLWAATSWNGLMRINPKTGQFKQYMPNLDDPHAITSREVWSLYKDTHNQLWVGTHMGGLHRYRRKQDDFLKIPYKIPSKSERSRILSILEGHTGKLWVAADSKVYVIPSKDLRNNNATLHAASGQNTKLSKLSMPPYNDIYMDSQNNLWFTTSGNGIGVLNEDNSQFTTYRVEHGLAGNTATAIEEDDTGHIWISTSEGISRFNPKNQKFQTYTAKHGLPSNTYRHPISFRTTKNELIFGNNDGLTIINPKYLFHNQYAAPIVVTDLLIFNQPVSIENATQPSIDTKQLNNEPSEAIQSPLTKSITHTKVLTLDASQSVFTFEFSLLNYDIPAMNLYSYKLEGFDKNWTPPSNRRTATYTNIDPGHYTFLVKGANNEGLWSEQAHEIQIYILPPWWARWWARTVYILSIIASIALAIYIQYRKRQQAEALSHLLEVKVRERTKELAQKNHDIQNMLSSMQQGLFTIEIGGKIHREYSKSLEIIFETTDVANRNVIAFLFTLCKVDSNHVDQVKAAVDAIIDEHKVNFELNSHLLLREYDLIFQRENQQKIKHLELTWTPILKNDIVTKLMVSVWDRTVIKQLEGESRAQKRELAIIGELLNISMPKLQTFITDTEDLIHKNRQAIHQLNVVKSHTLNANILNDKEKESFIARLYRNMHTIKGNSRTFSFSFLSDAAHRAESGYNLLKSHPQEQWDRQALQINLTDLENTLQEYKCISKNVLNREQHADPRKHDGIWLTTNTVDKVLQQDNASSIKKILNKALSKRLDEVLDDIVSSIPSMAVDIGKEPPQIIIDSPRVRIRNEACHLINNVFLHLLRNCLDHGLEKPALRAHSDKEPRGTIVICAIVIDDTLEISIKDDGRGLNISRLYDKGVEYGYWTENEAPTRDEVANLIFRSGVSTKKHVTDISGRGVGMDAVKQLLNDNGGDISLDLRDNSNSLEGYAPFETHLVLPSSLFVKF